MGRTPHLRSETLWQEYKRRVRPVIMDLLLWLTVMAGMLIVFAGLKVMEAAGFSKDRIQVLENIHFLADACILVGFSFDMIMKILAVVLD